MEIILLAILIIIAVETSWLTVVKLKQRTLKVARGSLLLDTSAIMDGRIVDVAKTGVITAEIIVPRSVINELQLLADRADHDKRMRARRGLENIRELQKLETVSVTVVNDGQVGAGGVDERLLELAKNYDASIATTDFNLNKVAKVVGITVVNVNELSQILRIQHLAGETVEIQLIQPGANREQAVGYLDDGTMVVVEDAKNSIGQRLRVEIVRSLQTEAGRMMFAKKTAPARVKAAPAFHSDQLKNNNQPRRKGHTKKTPRRQEPKTSAEDSMVALANRK
ncbi:MAG: TRAM domain-containing protein [Candidatus Nomurabacteria bacterium]|jgi:uncharacterized protein YacL|nr:TRAM domain-containing protein [Candidatus Nomurabacteria bacterium]